MFAVSEKVLTFATALREQRRSPVRRVREDLETSDGC